MLLALEKILQSQGFGSRKQCQTLIRAGQVSIAGHICANPLQAFATEGLAFTLDGECHLYRAQVYLALNKPSGFECSRQPQHHRSVFSLLPDHLQRRNVQPVGRLDHDTTGLLLLSDDGGFIHALASPRRHVAKTYLVRTASAITETMAENLRSGVLLRDESLPLAARNVQIIDDHCLSLTITQGKYHQVKRMLAAVGNHVAALHRSAIGALQLDSPALSALPEGAWCYLDDFELLRDLYQQP